jgi:hypothetical protein
MTIQLPFQEGNSFVRNLELGTMRAFALVRGLLRAVPESLRSLRDTVALECFLIDAARAGHCRATALGILEDVVRDRSGRGLCVHMRCAAPRALAAMAQAERAADAQIPAQRTVTGELSGRDWFEPLTSVQPCPACGTPTVAGMGCEACASRMRHPSSEAVQLPWPPPGFTLCPGCSGAVRAGEGCPVCGERAVLRAEAVADLPDMPQDDAAAADAWVLEQFGEDALETAPMLCRHPEESRWELADGTLAVRCAHCGNAMVGAEPGAWPILSPAWAFANGEYVDDVNP